MFVKQCSDTSSHEPHTHTVTWEKKKLPYLLHPEKYPDTWTAQYRCPGYAVVAWTVDYLHEDCTPCEACADMAVNSALEQGAESQVWREIGPDEAIAHMAEVTRV